MIRRTGVVLALFVAHSASVGAGGAGVANAQKGAGFSVSVSGVGAARVPIVQVRGVLADPGLLNALESGLPLRFDFRIELWRKAFFDRLVDEREAGIAILQDPLDNSYVVESPGEQSRYGTIGEAERAVERALRSRLRPSTGGRHYYLATLDVETLSLSDLDELRRWLRGEVGPAVQGRSSPTGAVESGLRRLFVRVIGLPTRSYEARSATFTVP
jgi:hypothetical protein